jgi:hypothetical protein
MIADALAEIERFPSAAADRTNLARERLLAAFRAKEWLAAVETIYDAATISLRGSSPSHR